MSPGDERFLRELYASTRDELAIWPEEERAVLVDLQLRAQQRNWEARFPDAEHEIVVLGEEPVGRSYVAWSPAECRIVDLALLPEYRSVGLGTVLVSETLERAERAGLPVRISVFRANERAIAFWMRMGFERSGGDEMYLSFERAPVSEAYFARTAQEVQLGQSCVS